MGIATKSSGPTRKGPDVLAEPCADTVPMFADSEDEAEVFLAERLEVHPVAALFPMMTEDELGDLAADIKQNGLVHPIVLDEDGRLIDGRNRLESCNRACVEPTFTTLPKGQDPVAFILSCNIERRHLNKGQQAMVRALARVSGSAKNALPLDDEAAFSGIARRYLTQANVVRCYAPDLADSVLAGSTSLNDAYMEARRRKEAAETDEAKFARLQEAAPDIACMVQEERLTLAGALAELQERHRQEEQRLREELENRRLLSCQLDRMLLSLNPGKISPDDIARRFLEEADAGLVSETAEFTSERVQQAAEGLLRYAQLLREKEQNAKK